MVSGEAMNGGWLSLCTLNMHRMFSHSWTIHVHVVAVHEHCSIKFSKYCIITKWKVNEFMVERNLLLFTGKLQQSKCSLIPVAAVAAPLMVHTVPLRNCTT